MYVPAVFPRAPGMERLRLCIHHGLVPVLLRSTEELRKLSTLRANVTSECSCPRAVGGCICL